MESTETTKRLRVGDVLVERGLITTAQVDEAFNVQQGEGKRRLLGEILIELGYCTQAQITATLANAYGIPFVELSPAFVDPDVIAMLPRDFITERQVLPLFHVDGVLTVAVTEASDFFLVDEIRQLTDATVQIVAALPENIKNTLDRVGPDETAASLEELFEEATQASGATADTTRTDVEDLGSDSPVVKLVNHAIQSAVREGASDIHFEPGENTFRVRFRIDGQLVEKLHPPHQMMAPIVARIKIMAGMDISERRLPQDGAIRINHRGKPVDLRVSTLPNKFGEKVVTRIIDNSSSLLTFDGLGLPTETRAGLERICKNPYGIILVTGPTGSGKSSTLYSMLNHLNNPTINICTVEDPVEFNLAGVNQFQVHGKIGLNFASMLRTLLRQDPDVIMIGEIRDPETAGIAVQAALTGHLVLSTLHTNDSPSAITRLQNLSVEPYLVSAAIVGIVAQRLVRRICRDCCVEEAPTPSIARAAERAGMQLKRVHKGRGCATCNQTGYKGRTGLYEILAPDDDFRDAIASGANLGALRQKAKELGMKNLFEFGLERVRRGETTVEELLRVTCE
jgi:type IV pilus assembly protein PilB